MDNNEAMSILECIGLNGKKEREAVRIAISAIEKQVPKKTVIITDKESHYKYRACIDCSEPAEESNYCVNCGQRLLED